MSGWRQAVRCFSPGGRWRPQLPGRACCLWMALWVAAFIGLTAKAMADVVGAKGKPLAVDVRLTGLRDGRLLYQLSSGREIDRPIEEIQYLRITGWDAFNEAEKACRDGRYSQAAAQYQKLLIELADASRREDGRSRSGFDRQLLIQCRLLQAYVASGEFDRAVGVYIEVIERMPACIESLRPAKVPPLGSTFLSSAGQIVDSAIQRHGEDAIAASLRQWRSTWPGAEPTVVQPIRPPVSPAPQATPPEPKAADAHDNLAELRTMIQAGRFAEALGRIDGLLASASTADLHYLRAKALLSSLVDKPAEQAQRDRRRAGLALMRVVIQFPDHPAVPECLFLAGELCRQSGHLEQGLGLWTELIQKHPSASPWADRARQSMAAVGVAASKPAG